ncbi:helix-turn-helix domain-containing protein [Streptomyces qinzhouensis]|uniref:Helix-turn-helix transcriptional regulator n=1 Tax=Streptomyces qinzhouensis TaxID=2599401 RepID=A0A5B8JDA5_9ACTN|nr:helix-turn-helix transcriptional regulator [Streptomyces qinzhouensis]QDY78374.1 helix-turn-helix transcriptional regulator [Streptomyces qinzhouensis]
MYTRKQQRKNASALRLVGKQVALFRKAAGLTQEQLAEHLGISLETVASIEQGRRALKLDYAERLDELLDTKGALVVAVQNMPEIDMIPAWAEQYMDMEQEALTLSYYENQLVPGLIQTPDYARAIFRCRVPAYSTDEIDRLVMKRMERQGILHRDSPTTISFIFSEAALRDRLGGDEVYTACLTHLRTCADLPGINIQILPLGTKGHAGLNTPYILVETPDYQDLAYVETHRGNQQVCNPDEVSILKQKYAMLRTQALNSDQTKGLLDRLLGER